MAVGAEWVFVWSEYPLRYTDPDGDSVVDITCGFASALDDNVPGGFGKYLLKKILLTSER